MPATMPNSFLMNLFRGSGTLGLSGIPPVRNNRYIRPLIEQPREGVMKLSSG